MPHVYGFVSLKQSRNRIKKGGSMKDAWDKFHSVSTFSSGVLIALIGLYFTHSYNERQSEREANMQAQNIKLQEMQTAEKYIPYLARGNEEERKAAVIMIRHLASEKLAIAVVEAYPSKGTREAGNIIMVSASPAEQHKEMVKTTAPISVKEATRKGWVYLGDYSVATGEWTTRYFEFGARTKPEILKGRVLKTKAAQNVRTYMPSPEAVFGKVIDILDAGSEVRVHEVRPWSTTGFMWARVSYSISPKQTAEEM
jgi:hypothetical protein